MIAGPNLWKQSCLHQQDMLKRTHIASMKWPAKRTPGTEFGHSKRVVGGELRHAKVVALELCMQLELRYWILDVMRLNLFVLKCVIALPKHVLCIPDDATAVRTRTCWADVLRHGYCVWYKSAAN